MSWWIAFNLRTGEACSAYDADYMPHRYFVADSPLTQEDWEDVLLEGRVTVPWPEELRNPEMDFGLMKLDRKITVDGVFYTAVAKTEEDFEKDAERYK